MKKSLLLVAALLISIVCQAQLIPVSKLNLKSAQVFVRHTDAKTKVETYKAEVKKKVKGFARIDYVKTSKTTWFVLQSSSLGTNPIKHIVRSAKKEQREDGSMFYDVDAENLQGKPVKLILIYRGAQLMSANIDVKTAFYQYE